MIMTYRCKKGNTTEWAERVASLPGVGSICIYCENLWDVNLNDRNPDQFPTFVKDQLIGNVILELTGRGGR